MLTFFKISTYAAITTLFLLSLVTLSDVFIHSNQTRFYIITIAIAIIFFLMGWMGVIVYRNFRNIHNYMMAGKQTGQAQTSLLKLMLFSSIIAVTITLISCSICFALIQRMEGGTALFG